MALKLRSKDVKKSSYYVWFLGAKESRGVRGADYVLPIITHLEQRERDLEPFKVTLQVSHKGLKIIQNVNKHTSAAHSIGNTNGTTVNTTKNTSSGTNETTIKHFIPHNTITCVYQQEDVIACILLLFNPVTKCPLHVHAYRCDSVETASVLKQQLEALIERPENQKKYAEIEQRLEASRAGTNSASTTNISNSSTNVQNKRNLLSMSNGGSCGSSAKESESSEEFRYNQQHSSGGTALVQHPPGGSVLNQHSSSGSALVNAGQPQRGVQQQNSGTGRGTTTNLLYDSVAAELRAKLSSATKNTVKNQTPILLPPRDYDTVHRQRGNLAGIELRRCLNSNIVGRQNTSSNKKVLLSSTSNTQILHHGTTNTSTTATNLSNGGGGGGGGSSGIGSDHPPSPIEGRFTTTPLDNQSTSDEEWIANGGYNDSTPYFSHCNTPNLILPRPNNQHEQQHNQQQQPVNHVNKTSNHFHHERQSSSSSRSKSPVNYGRKKKEHDFQNSPNKKPLKYFEDDGFQDGDEFGRHRSSAQPVPRARQRFVAEEAREEYQMMATTTTPSDRFRDAREKFEQMTSAMTAFKMSERETPIAPVMQRMNIVKRHESMRPQPAPRNLDDVTSKPPRRSMYAKDDEYRQLAANEIAKEMKRRSYIIETSTNSQFFNNNNNNDNQYSGNVGSADNYGGYHHHNNNNNHHQYQQRHSYAEKPIPRLDSRITGGATSGDGGGIQRTNSILANGRVGIASLQPY